MARSTTAAITQNHEWSSTRVTILAFRSSPVAVLTSLIPPTMSMPHSCIESGRWQRWKEDAGRSRGR
ncbi:hypothetical protein [Actinopolymorpha pittospori]|uniref:Uncharacterized protein n=1 Tax=Actinopolymorpha pittospori TaxID=648752 RepID=A0A927MVF5_9ACTN|nr:hypothetical protein [Actinopolymorpha pittospori]MBE1604030.1 hypothetical protein [Actinopolymorpha pittospori]